MSPHGSNWLDWLFSASLPTIHHPFNYGTMIHAALARLLFFKGTRMGLCGRPTSDRDPGHFWCRIYGCTKVESEYCRLFAV